VSSTQGRVGLRLGFSENFRFRLGLGFCSTGLGWVSVFTFQNFVLYGKPWSTTPEINENEINIFNGRPWFDHAAPCCKESLNKIFDKKINPKKFFLVKFS
jgi:hypothetical protein